MSKITSALTSLGFPIVVTLGSALACAVGVPTFTPVQPELFSKPKAMANAWADFNLDGQWDLVVTFATGEIHLYRNGGNGYFTEVGAAMGLPGTPGSKVTSVSWGDYDGDGYPDLYVGTLEKNVRNALFHNDGGKGFNEVAQPLGVDLSQGNSSRQANWIDYDNDGDLDLFVANREGPDHLFRNDGGKYFADVSEKSGLADPRSTVGACWFDMDQDGDLDVFLAHQSGGTDALYRNDHGRFRDIAPELGMDQPGRSVAEGGVGCSVGDYDGDGQFDIFLATYGVSRLYHNAGNGRFQDVAENLGISGHARMVGVSWGDYDNDGLLDLFVAGYDQAKDVPKPGEAIYWPNGRLFHNEGDRFFNVLTEKSPLNRVDHGVQWVDFDGDGDLDVSLTQNYPNDGTHPVLRNEFSGEARSHSLQVLVLDKKGHYTRVGSEVRLFDRRGRLLGSRLVPSGDGYCSQSAIPVHFGLARFAPVTVEVTFLTPNGRKTQRIEHVDPKPWIGKALVVRQKQ